MCKLFTALLSLALASTALAAEKKPKKSAGKSNGVPPTSAMIVVPQVPDATPAPSGTGGLITSDLSGRDLMFFSILVQAGRIQAYLVDQVTTKGDSDSIKAVGAALAATQSEENKQISRLASLKGLTIPSDSPSDLKKISADLEKLSGSNFDKTAMDGIIAAGRQSMGAYESAAQSSDGDIKAFSEQMLPIAKEKLRLAEKMTGAGAKTASQLFRTGAPAKATKPAPATPAAAPATPAATPTAEPVASPAKSAPAPATQTISIPKPAATPATTPATPPPLNLPLATPPGAPSVPKFIPPPITK